MLRDLLLLSPLHIVVLTAVITLLASVVPVATTRAFMARMAATGFALALGAVVMIWGDPEATLTHPSLVSSLALGPATLLTWALLLLIGFLVVLLSADHLPEQGIDHGEFYALTVFAIGGMMAMVAAREFFTLFIGLETFSLAIYVLCGFKRGSIFAVEACLKYFILGSFASAILLLGIAFAYGASGTTDIRDLGHVIEAGTAPAFAGISLVLLLAGFCFKIAAVPFHAWTPDTYEGAPTPVTALMAAGVKTAAVVAFARVFLTAFAGRGTGLLIATWPELVEALALITIIYGNLAALSQVNVKRMLSYSAIAHAGYLLLAIAAIPAWSTADAAAEGGLGSALLYYLFGYSVANLAAFGVLGLFGADGREDIDTFMLSGVARRHPVLAVVLSLALLSLAGIPPTAGFFGKLVLFREVLHVRPDLITLVVVAALGSAVSLVYYVRPIVRMYMYEAYRPVRTIRSGAAWVALALAAALLLHAGVRPGTWLDLGAQASPDLALTTAASANKVAAK